MLKFELNIPIDISLCVSIRNNKNPIVGIYKITSPTGCINIGQATDIENRFSYYKRLACKGQKRLYNSLKKYGVKNHTFEIIHLCKKEELNELECYYVKLFDTFNTPHGLNLKGGGARGKLSDESKNRLSKSQKERFNFLSYEDCKKWIKENELTKNIKTSNEWNEIKNNLPIFIPKAPLTTYQNEGWESWSDFLGTRNKKGGWYSYKESKKWIRENKLTKNIKTQKEWYKISKSLLLPKYIPKDPQGCYTREGTWKGWGDFLGTGFIATKNRIYYDYEKCKKWIKNNTLTKSIKSRFEFNKIKNKLPDFIPQCPEGFYKRQGTWKGWGYFLETGMIANKNRIYYDYEKCKKWIKENELTKNIKTQKDWERFYRHKLPLFIPKDPPSYYRKQGVWNGWGDFLGTGNKHKGDFFNYEAAKKWLMKNPFTKNLKSKKEWCDIKSKLPSFIPKSPDFVYKNKGWKGWLSFLK